ncbi:MAG: hypothetical protein A2X46_15900 [Lentisphaerae bacterium GWF2_57_35]|nr:MAG: hypothetical protein A2X46_15900 [Lentisphaerae bacterium GWF2_57_35]
MDFCLTNANEKNVCRQIAAITYAGITAQIREQMLGLLDRRSNASIFSYRQAPSSIREIVESVGRLMELNTRDSEPEFHRLLQRILSNSAINALIKLQVAEQYCALTGGQNAAWVIQDLNDNELTAPHQQLPFINLCLWTNQFAKAKTAADKVIESKAQSICDHLAAKAVSWHVRDRRRASLFCWHQAAKTGPLNPAQILTFCMLLLDIGRVSAAKRIFRKIEHSACHANPDDQLRTAFARHMLSLSSEEDLRNEAESLLQRTSLNASFIRLFHPCCNQLFYRLEIPHPNACDKKLARAYSQLLLAEWHLKRFSPESLLVGSKFLAYSDLMPQAMEIMGERQIKDSTFVDGFSSLAVYAWIAGMNDAAQACYAREPLERPHTSLGWLRMALAAALLGKICEAERFLKRLYDQAPDFFIQQPSSTRLWGILSILLKTMGWERAAKQVAIFASSDPYWKYRQHLFVRCPIAEKTAAIPAFKWPAFFQQDSFWN